MAPDTKSALKEAKNGIKEADYERAVKYCKIVLKHDRGNYQALVMLGKASKELKKYDDSKMALLLASKTEPETPVAWQGLAMLYDTNPEISTPKEVVMVYTKLVELIDDADKRIVYLRKLATAHEAASNTIAAADTLLALVPLLKDDKNASKETSQKVVNLLAPQQELLSLEKRDYLINSLESLLSDSVIGNNETNFKLYLSLIYKCGDTQRTYEAALSMSKVFPTAYPLEWVARIYVESTVPWKGVSNAQVLLWEDCVAPITTLLNIYSESVWGNLALGLQQEKKGNVAAAITRYTAACRRSSRYVIHL